MQHRLLSRPDQQHRLDLTRRVPAEQYMAFSNPTVGMLLMLAFCSNLLYMSGLAALQVMVAPGCRIASFF
jgi:hypothetical protein